MKLQFKHQKFQADAAKAVVDVFAGHVGEIFKLMAPDTRVKVI